MKNKVFYIIFCLLVLLVGCKSNKIAENLNDGTNNAGNSSCIPPEISFSYPVKVRTIDDSSDVPNIEPSAPWQEVTKIPAMDYNLTPFVTRTTKDGNIEIWFAYENKLLDISRLDFKNRSVYIYQSNTNDWFQIDDSIEGSQAHVFNIFLRKNGEIWVDGYSSSDHVIGKFDELEKVFISKSKNDSIPPGPILFDQDRDLLWIFSNNQGIYSFDLVTLETQLWINLPKLNIINSETNPKISLSPDGDIYFLSPDDNNESLLYQFIPEQNNIQLIYNPLLETDAPPLNLFITKSGDLWLNDSGWRDKNGQWFKTIRSPVFISNRIPENGYIYEWPMAILVYESSNGELWFRSTNGMTVLNPHKEEWCWFTTDENALLTEDDNKTLWLIAYGKLYKQEIK